MQGIVTLCFLQVLKYAYGRFAHPVHGGEEVGTKVDKCTNCGIPLNQHDEQENGHNKTFGFMNMSETKFPPGRCGL